MSGADASGPSDWAVMVDDCERRESKLTDWERSFVDSMRMRLGEGRGLTPEMVKKLDEIWERVT